MGHHKDKCPQPLKEKQTVKAYAIDVVPSSSNAPTAAEKGKNVVIQSIFLFMMYQFEFCLILGLPVPSYLVTW